jgi:hypothetical protein
MAHPLSALRVVPQIASICVCLDAWVAKYLPPHEATAEAL